MQVYHDSGGGITEVSKKHFARMLRRLSGFRPVQVTVHAEGEYTFELYGFHGDEAIVILESGFNSGYSGEGPCGTKWALEQLGVPEALAEEVLYYRDKVIDFRGGEPHTKAE